MQYWPKRELSAADTTLETLAARVTALEFQVELLTDMVQVRPRFMTVKQAAAYLGRTERAIRDLIHKGRIPYAKVAGRVMLETAKLDEWAGITPRR